MPLQSHTCRCYCAFDLYLTYRCPKISAVGFEHIAAHAHNLSQLSICCEDLLDSGLLLLARGACANLQTLSLDNCAKMTNSGLMYLSRGCANLTSLYIHDCRGLTDMGVQSALVPGRFPALKTFFLNYCNISPSVIDYLRRTRRDLLVQNEDS